MTPTPLSSLVRLKEVPRSLDWKFIDNFPPPSDEIKRQYVFLNEVSLYVLHTITRSVVHLHAFSTISVL